MLGLGLSLDILLFGKSIYVIVGCLVLVDIIIFNYGSFMEVSLDMFGFSLDVFFFFYFFSYLDNFSYVDIIIDENILGILRIVEEFRRKFISL